MSLDLDRIQSLIKFIARSGATEVELETDEFKITVKNGSPEKLVERIHTPYSTPGPIVQTLAIPQESIEQSPAPAVAAPPAAPSNNYVTVKSPMIGTFYRSPSPDKPPFINVGDVIEKGKVLCIIEAMKLFNEIESEVSGKIIKVLVDDTKPVEYDQPLFLVEPN